MSSGHARRQQARFAAGDTREERDITRSLQEPVAASAALEERGYVVLRELIPRDVVDGALRYLNLDLVERGLPAETLGEWLWSTHWFPHLRWDPPIVALAWHLPDELRDGEMCDPQIVLQPPDADDDQPLVPHVDREPEWSAGRQYRLIVGVPLTRAYAENGGLVVWPFDSQQEPLTLEAGDVLVMHPKLPHASSLNREGAIRYAVYFRFLER